MTQFHAVAGSGGVLGVTLHAQEDGTFWAEIETRRGARALYTQRGELRTLSDPRKFFSLFKGAGVPLIRINVTEWPEERGNPRRSAV